MWRDMMVAKEDYIKQSRRTGKGRIFLITCPDGTQEMFDDELCADEWIRLDIIERNLKEPKTVDLTPTWAAIFPMMLESYYYARVQERHETVAILKEEFMSVARFADAVNAERKEAKDVS